MPEKRGKDATKGVSKETKKLGQEGDSCVFDTGGSWWEMKTTTGAREGGGGLGGGGFPTCVQKKSARHTN